MKKIVLVLMLFSLMPNSNFSTVDNNAARIPLILTGISMMIIGNQDRQTDSGKLLQIGGTLLTAVWVF